MNDPHRLYEREILPRLKELEGQRLGARTWVVFITLALLGGTVIAIIKFPAILKLGKIGKLLGIVFVAGATIPIMLFRGKRKRMFVPLVLKLCGHPDLTYTCRANLKAGELQALGGWNPGTLVTAEDGVTGARRGLRFHFNEVRVKQRRGSSSDYDQVFRGWVLSIDTPFSIGRTAVEFRCGHDGAVTEVLVIEGSPDDARRRLPPDLLGHAAVLAGAAGGRKGVAVIDGKRFALIIETSRDIFESIADADAKLSPEAFARLVEELNALTRTVTGITAELARPPSAMPVLEDAGPGIG